MKKVLLFCLTAVILVSVFISCSRKNDDPSDQTSSSDTITDLQEGIALDVTDGVTIGVDETRKLTAINLSNGKVTSNVLWSSSDIGIVTVDISGNLKGVSDGTATVTAASIDGKYSASCVVTVSSSVTSVSLDPTTLQLSVGESRKLEATIYPLNTKASNVKWTSSVESVAKVSDDGTVTAISNGVTSICVTVENKFFAFCQISVVTPVTGITINDSTIQINKGGYADISYSVLPIDATDKNVIWTSSNDNVAAVIDGRVTGIGTGTATLTATAANGMTAKCTVTVRSPVLGVTLNYSEITLHCGDKETLIATINPVDANNQNVTWLSSDPDIVSVSSETGEITAIDSGVATITVKTSENSFTAECIVTVTKPVTSLAFDSLSYDVNVGETLQLIPVILPEGADPEQFTWSSSDPQMAAVSENGLVTGIGHGQTVITVLSKYGATASCTVNSIDPEKLVVPVTSVTNDSQYYSIYIGQTIKLNLTVLPENATNKAITVESSNPSCVSINDTEITGLSAGIITLTVKTSNPEVKLDIIVQIKPLTDDEIAAKTAEYQTKIKNENDRHTSVISKLESDFNKESSDLNTMLASLSVSGEDNYLTDKAMYENLLTSYENSKKVAEDDKNASLVEWYNNQIKSVNDKLKALESSYNTRLSIEKKLKSLRDKYAEDRSTEDVLHENTVSQIEQEYQFIKQYIK